jgi:hypothetical protein
MVLTRLAIRAQGTAGTSVAGFWGDYCCDAAAIEEGFHVPKRYTFASVYSSVKRHYGFQVAGNSSTLRP